MRREEKKILETFREQVQKVPSELKSGKYTKEEQREASHRLNTISDQLEKQGRAFVALEPTDSLTPLTAYLIMAAYGTMTLEPVVAMDGNILLRIFQD